jgi:hypothetical protein
VVAVLMIWSAFLSFAPRVSFNSLSFIFVCFSVSFC